MMFYSQQHKTRAQGIPATILITTVSAAKTSIIPVAVSAGLAETLTDVPGITLGAGEAQSGARGISLGVLATPKGATEITFGAVKASAGAPKITLGVVAIPTGDPGITSGLAETMAGVVGVPVATGVPVLPARIFLPRAAFSTSVRLTDSACPNIAMFL